MLHILKQGLYIIIALVIFYLVYTAYEELSYRTNHIGEKSMRLSAKDASHRRFGLIIDVREPEERESMGYYPNSIPVSFNKLKVEVPFINSNRGTTIMVYSNGDGKAERAASILSNMGYQQENYITETYLSLLPGSNMQ
jgi:rhodanese-related sulfurtransferase